MQHELPPQRDDTRYDEGIVSTIAADGIQTTTGSSHVEGSVDGGSTLHEQMFESFEEWVTGLDASSHRYDETDTDRTTVTTLDEDIDRTDTYFSDGTLSSVDNSTSNSGSDISETVTSGGFWSVTQQVATTSGSYGTLKSPTKSAYLLALGSSGTSSSGTGGTATAYASVTESAAALGLAVEQSGLQLPTSTDPQDTTSTDPTGSEAVGIADLYRPDWLSALGLGHRRTGELDLANALAWAGGDPTNYQQHLNKGRDDLRKRLKESIGPTTKITVEIICTSNGHGTPGRDVIVIRLLSLGEFGGIIETIRIPDIGGAQGADEKAQLAIANLRKVTDVEFAKAVSGIISGAIDIGALAPEMVARLIFFSPGAFW